MKKELKILIWVLPACLLCIVAFFLMHKITSDDDPVKDKVKVGLVLEGDESTPYSSNFIRATDELKLQYGDRVEVEPMYNVAYENSSDAIEKLCSDGCDIIFFNSVEFGEQAKSAAARHPEVEFCQKAGIQVLQ